MQEAVRTISGGRSGTKKPPSKKRKNGKPRKGASAASTRNPTSELPPRFRGTPVPVSIRITWIGPTHHIPALAREFDEHCAVDYDLVITVGGKRVPGLSYDEFAAPFGRGKAAVVPGFDRLVLDREALVAELAAFVAETKRLVLSAAPSHAVAARWWAGTSPRPSTRSRTMSYER